jgi:hypothetical protein
MSPSLLAALVLIPTAAVIVALFAVMWRRRSSPRTARVAVVGGIVLAAWAIVTAKLALDGFYAPDEAQAFPPIGLPLIVALVLLALAVATSPSLRTLLSDQKDLIRLNLWRLEGAVFLLLAVTGQVPLLWAIPAGVGDVLVGSTAFWVASRLDAPGGKRLAVAFNVFGLMDLVVAVGLGIATSPGPTRLFLTTPTSELLTRFPLALVPTFLVPLAFALHIVSLWQLSRGSWAHST